MENADCGRTCVEVDSFNNVIAKLIYFSVTSNASVTSMKIARYSGNQLTGNFIRKKILYREVEIHSIFVQAGRTDSPGSLYERKIFISGKSRYD